MKILFVCKHNRFRSKIAEAYFKKINKNRRIKVASAGVFKGYPTEPVVVKIGKKFGLNIPRTTKGLNEDEIYKTDLLIIVADNVPSLLFKGKVKKIIVWKISDTNQNNTKRIGEITKDIIKRVQILIKQLENAK